MIISKFEEAIRFRTLRPYFDYYGLSINWETSCKPFHRIWWYRILTGRKFTYPFMEKNSYYKRNIKTREVVEAGLLNKYSQFRFWLNRKLFT